MDTRPTVTIEASNGHTVTADIRLDDQEVARIVRVVIEGNVDNPINAASTRLIKLGEVFDLLRRDGYKIDRRGMPTPADELELARHLGSAKNVAKEFGVGRTTAYRYLR